MVSYPTKKQTIGRPFSSKQKVPEGRGGGGGKTASQVMSLVTLEYFELSGWVAWSIFNNQSSFQDSFLHIFWCAQK